MEEHKKGHSIPCEAPPSVGLAQSLHIKGIINIIKY